MNRLISEFNVYGNMMRQLPISQKRYKDVPGVRLEKRILSIINFRMLRE